MARGRMISKSLSTSEKFASLSDVAGALAEFCQTLYPLVVVHADDFGRLQGDAFTVKHTCFPTSPRTIAEFSDALANLHNVGLLRLYSVESKRYIQIENFDPHQQGLHKRTQSTFPEIPGDSRKLPESIGNSGLREGKGRELKGREQNRTEEKIPVISNQVDREVGAPIKAPFGVPRNGSNGTNGHQTEPNMRSKHPVFKGQRFVVFDWQYEDLGRLLGPHFEDFDLDLWFDRLDKQLVKDKQVVPQRDKGEWLQARCLEEAKKRGLSIVSAKPKKMSAAELADAVRADMKAAGEL